jgi:hypothetical protein
MKALFKHLIVGVVLSTIFAVGAYKLFPKAGINLSKYLMNIPIGTISYIIIKSFNVWFYNHFTIFGENVVRTYIFDMFIWPLVASGWWIILQ